MVDIIKQGSSLVVTNNEDFPWGKGELSLPLNSTSFIVDASDVIVFRSVANNDILFQSRIDELTINGTPATKENIVDLFDAASNTATGGGGQGGGAVDSVNGKVGAVVLTANDVDAYTKQEIEDKGYLTEIPSTYTTDDELNAAIQGVENKIPNTENLATKNELNVGLEGKADKTSIADMATKSWVGEQDYATNTLVESKLDKNTYNEDKPTFALKSEIPSLDGYATQSWVGEQGYLKAIPEDYAKKTDIDTAVADKVSTTALNEAIQGVENKIPSTENLATKDEVSLKQDKLVGTEIEGQNIKTINGNSILGSGNITIEGGSTITIDSELSASSENPVQNKVIDAALKTKADSSAIADMATQSWVNGKDYATNSTVNGKLDSSVYNQDKPTFATKSEVNGKAKVVTLTQSDYDSLSTKEENVIYNISDAESINPDTFALKTDITDMATQTWVNNKNYLTSVPSEYITESELNSKNYATVSQLPNISGKLDTSVYDEDKKTFALKSELPDISTKQDKLIGTEVEGQNIKTINGQTLLGNGNITIENTIDSELNTESENPVQNKIITSALNKKVESVELTQDEYNQLEVKDPNIMYVITDAPKIEDNVFDATPLFTASQNPQDKTVTEEFQTAILKAITEKKVMVIHNGEVNVVVTFAQKKDGSVMFTATNNMQLFYIQLNTISREVAIEQKAVGTGTFDKYANEQSHSIFDLTTESTNNDIQVAFSTNENGVKIPQVGDVIEVKDIDDNITDSGIVISNIKAADQIDLIFVKNNIVDDFIVYFNLKINYNEAQGFDSLKVMRSTHYEVNPALISDTAMQALNGKIENKVEKSTYEADKATFALKTELVKISKLTQSDYDQLTSKDPNTLYIITDATA